MYAYLTWPEALTIGLVQGVTELFPVSSLGHSVLIPAIVGGSWARDLSVSSAESPYLAFIVGLHVATAIALIIYFWRDWVAIVTGLVRSAVRRRIETDVERLAWLLVLATIPVGILGLVLEHTLRTALGKATPAAIFLIINGLILWFCERARRTTGPEEVPAASDGGVPTVASPATTTVLAAPMTAHDVEQDRMLGRMPLRQAMFIGTSQCLALAPGISRSGIALATGVLRGLPRESAARFSFLLSTPVILAAGVLKLPDLTGPLGNGIRPQIVVASILSGIGAYLSVRFLSRYFENRSMKPFAWYCVIAGVASLVWVNR